MSNAGHTPGPRHVANGVQIRSANHQIAKVWMMHNGEGVANAAMLAAAPKLLAFAKLVLAGLESGNINANPVFVPYFDAPSMDPVALIDVARSLVANATGETT